MTEIAAIEARNIVKVFGRVIALSGVSMAVVPGSVLCLLGDNGAGKSTLIKVLAGVHQPTSGSLTVGGRPVAFASPRDALVEGIATVFQDLALIPLMSITRNFFMGREPTRGRGPLRRLDLTLADQVTRDEMTRIGIDVRDPRQPVGTLSGGERQCLAIARAVHFGARVLILDEPTSALGVAQTAMVLRYIDQVRKKGLAVVFITHNVQHAIAIGDSFTVLNRGRTIGNYKRGEIDALALQSLMAGGKTLERIGETADAEDHPG